MKLRAGEVKTVWFGVGGSTSGPAQARAELHKALDNPEAAIGAVVRFRERMNALSEVSLPGNQLLAGSVAWSKQMLAASEQRVNDLQLRAVNAGQAYPPPASTLKSMRWLGAGWPDYTWLFATDGEYTAFAAVAAGQFGPIKDHLRALRDVSEIVNQGSGKIVHEVTPDGAVYFGASVKAMKYVSTLDEDGDGWPEGLGNVERASMGEEKLDNAVYTIRGYADLADLANAVGDGQTKRWATKKAKALLDKFEDDWWYPTDGARSYADSVDDPGNTRSSSDTGSDSLPPTLCCQRCLVARRRPWRRTNTRIPRSRNTNGHASPAGWDSSIPAPGRPRLPPATRVRAATRWCLLCPASGASSRSTAPSQR